MTLRIDLPRWPAHGRLWSHLVSDTSVEELHVFAERCGIPRRSFEGDHYDIPEERYAAVVAAGAVAIEGRDLVRLLRDSGIRLQKRKGEKGIARVEGVRFADGTTADVDLISSNRLAGDARTLAAMVFVRDIDGRLATVWSPRRQEWGAPGGWRDGAESVADNAIREVSEETGLVLRAEQLRPCGYERFHHRDGGGLWPPGQDLLQAFVADLDEAAPPLAATLDDATGQVWLTPAEFAHRCGHLFWWPLADRVLNGGGGPAHA